MRDLIRAINVGVIEFIEVETVKLLAVGHSSGSDTLTGMILGIYGGLNED